MRITDHRYAGEMAKFNLAVRMIGHEARTGTIRACTGLSEDRIRKIYGTYFRQAPEIKRRRGKSPSQIGAFVGTAAQQSEATVLACLFLYCDLLQLDDKGKQLRALPLDPLALGERLCDAFETYVSLLPQPTLCFERAWSLYRALADDQELWFAHCAECGGPYIQDRYALDYAHCPFCDIKHCN